MIIKLDNIKKLRKFVDDCARMDAEIVVTEIGSNHFTANAKSFLGLATLNLMGPLRLRVLQANREKDIYDALREYRCAIPDALQSPE